MPDHNQTSSYTEERENGWPRNTRVYHEQKGWVEEQKFNELENNAFGTKQWDALNSAVQPVKDFIGDVAQQPIVKQIVETISPTITKAYGAIRYSPGPIKTFADNVEGSKEVLDEKLNTAGVDTRWGDAGVALFEEFVSAGVGKGLSTAVKAADYLSTANRFVPVSAGGGLHLGRQVLNNDLTPTVMKAVTIDNPQVASVTGRKLGDEIIANDPELGRHLTKRGQRIQELENKVEQNREIALVSNNPKEVKSARAKVKKTPALIYSERSNVKPFTEADPQLYGSPKGRAQGRAVWDVERARKGQKITEAVHAHHLVTKGGTAAAFKKMEEFVAQGKAHMDDVITMFEYAEKRGVKPGDARSNNAWIQDTPHNQLHQEVLIPAGDEFKQKQWEDILKAQDTPEKLMDWWVDQVDNNYVPNKATGQIWQDLDDLINDVRSLN